MKGYYTSNGFYGCVDGHYQYFSSQSDYLLEMECQRGRNTDLDQYESLARNLWWD